MNIQKSLYQCLLRLGVNMIRPQGYMCSEVSGKPNLVLGFLKWGEGGMYLLLSTYLMEDHKALPVPEVVLWVSPKQKRATAFTCAWQNDKEGASTELDHRVLFWLGLQLVCGHHFRGQQQLSGNVVALPSMKRGQSIKPL